MTFSWRRKKAGRPGKSRPSDQNSNMELTIPTHFRCPISLDLMKDPVTLSTGITYDRESIEKWTEAGNQTCPVTNQVLTSFEVIPNHALRKMIQDWSVSKKSFGIERVPTPKIVITSNDISDTSSGIMAASQRGDGYKCKELVRKIKNWAKESERNKTSIIESGVGYVLSASFEGFARVSIEKHEGLLEEILSTLIWMFPLGSEGQSKLGSPSSLRCMAWFLKSNNLSAKQNAVCALKELLSLDQEKVIALIEIEDVHESLFKLIKEPICPKATKASLLAIYYIISTNLILSPLQKSAPSSFVSLPKTEQQQQKEMDEDWGLLAVVKGCSAAATSTKPTTTTTSFSSSTTTTTKPSCSLDVYSLLPCFQTEQKDDSFMYFSDLHKPRSENTEGLHDLFKPVFCPKLLPISPQTIPISSPLSVLDNLQDLSEPPQEKQKQVLVGSKTTFSTAAATTTRHNSQNPRSKKRKNQMKRVCQVPAEGLSSDMWSWRKYGQKPIKGSPYPRGYYRCSTSKSCVARKQVERNRSDPNMFIVTYSQEHNHPVPTHRNSLAGSTRQKPTSSQTVTDGESSKPTCSSPSSPTASLSPASEKIEVEEEEDDDNGLSDMALSDDFFMGLEEFTSLTAGDGFSDHIPYPWLANYNATTAAALAGK